MRALILCTCLLNLGYCDYWSDRNSFINGEQSRMLGSNIVLSSNEKIVNKLLMMLKHEEYDAGFNDPKTFLPAEHFFSSRSKIEQSEVFKVLLFLPKGGLLHTHDTALSSEDILYNLTYTDHLYGCVVNERIKLQFFKTPDRSCEWNLISKLRADNATFDNFLKSQLTLVIDNPKQVYTDINTVWDTFSNIFATVTPLLTYKPVFTEYFYKVLQELHEDNISYLEFRSTLPPVYDLDGKIYSQMEVVQMYKDELIKFNKKHNNCMSVKLIYAPIRKVSNATVNEYIKTAKEMLKTHGDFVVGFDLVGQEDLGYPLSSFINQLLSIKNDTKFFFHAGETNWYGSTTDMNLIDAVLLGTKRIGHGYALTKHPSVMREVKSKDIGIEISPISNQVLLLVEDMRNHPGAVLIAHGYPVVICNDDPTFWGARGLSYDWYMAFMGMASREADLRMLKKFAMNSIKYSSLDAHSKMELKVAWHKQWNRVMLEMAESAKKSIIPKKQHHHHH